MRDLWQTLVQAIATRTLKSRPRRIKSQTQVYLHILNQRYKLHNQSPRHQYTKQSATHDRCYGRSRPLNSTRLTALRAALGSLSRKFSHQIVHLHLLALREASLALIKSRRCKVPSNSADLACIGCGTIVYYSTLLAEATRLYS